MVDLKQLDPDTVFILMMIVGVFGAIFAYPREIMDFFVYSINAVATTKIIQITIQNAIISIGIGGFVFFMFHRLNKWSP